MKYNRSPKPNLDCNSMDGHIIGKNSSREPKHGPSERQWMFCKAKDMLRKEKKKGFPTILARWQEQESYRSSLKDCDIGEKEVVIYDQLALERHDCAATKAERIRYSQKWVLLAMENRWRHSAQKKSRERFFYKKKSVMLNSRVSDCRNAVPTVRRGVYTEYTTTTCMTYIRSVHKHARM